MVFHKRLAALVSGKFRQTDFEKMMFDQYADFVILFKLQFSSLLKIISQKENLPVLIHCTGGKDRTGFACALIMAVLGLPKEVIVHDYLVSNNCISDLERMLGSALLFMRFFGVTREKLMPLIEVRKEFLENAFETIKKEYGSFRKYLNTGLALDSNFANGLRSVLMG